MRWEMFQRPVRIAGYASSSNHYLQLLIIWLWCASRYQAHDVEKEHSELKLGAARNADYFLMDNSVKNILLKSTYISVDAQHKMLL